MWMWLAYLTTANAASESCLTNPHQLECCQPNGQTFCASNGSEDIINSCGSVIQSCNLQQWEYCSQNGTQASCVGGGPVNPNGPYIMCQSPTVSRNIYGNTKACAADEQCVTFQWCTKKTEAQCVWQCGGSAPGQPSFARWNNCSESVEICPGGCENGQCKPWVCPQPQASQQRCAFPGNIVNGCGEIVEQCKPWYTCLASATSQDCHCVPDPRPDLCANIEWKQFSVPAWLKQDGPNCVQDCTISSSYKSNFRCIDNHTWVYDEWEGSCKVTKTLHTCDAATNTVCGEWGRTTTPWSDSRCGQILDDPWDSFKFTSFGMWWSYCVKDQANDGSSFRALTCACGPGGCYTDQCNNIAGVQPTVPVWHTQLNGACYRDVRMVCSDFTIGWVSVLGSSNSWLTNPVSYPGVMKITQSQAQNLRVTCAWYTEAEGWNAQAGIQVYQLVTAPTNHQWSTTQSCWDNPWQDGCNVAPYLDYSIWRFSLAMAARKAFSGDYLRPERLNRAMLYNRLQDGWDVQVFNFMNGATWLTAKYVGNSLWGDNIYEQYVVWKDWRFRSLYPLYGTWIYEIGCGLMYNASKRSCGSQIIEIVPDNQWPVPDLVITKIARNSITMAQSWSLTEWVITYRNQWNRIATGVTITDIVPAQMRYADTIATSISLSGLTVSQSTVSGVVQDRVTWRLSQSLSPWHTWQIVMRSRYQPADTSIKTFTNMVQISTVTPWDPLGNNVARATVQLSNDVLWDLVWYDNNRNGLQDVGEMWVSGVVVDLYQCDSSVQWYRLRNNGAWNPNMPQSYEGVYLWSIVTSNTGYYVFPVDSSKLYYITIKEFPVGYSLTTQFTWAYNYEGFRNSNFNIQTRRSTCEYPELAVDAWLVYDRAVSCNAIQTSVQLYSTWGRVSYSCAHSGGTVWEFVVLSGSQVISRTPWFTGTVSVPLGDYTAQCIIDWSVSYAVIEHQPATQLTCAYRRNTVVPHDQCAVRSALDPLIPNLATMSQAIFIPQPLLYCNTSQLTDSAYQCISADVGSRILTQNPNSCTTSFTIHKPWSIGDRVWIDVNKNGIQDPSESGFSWAQVRLYQLSSCADLTGTLRSVATTSSTGMYLFSGLMSNTYKVEFVRPTWYEWTLRQVGTNTGVDSDAPQSSCIVLDTQTNPNILTIDAGVYTTASPVCDPSVICCDGRCGWGWWGWWSSDWCGDGRMRWSVVVGNRVYPEQCDDGNNANGDGCSSSCQIESPVAPVLTGRNIVQNLSCGMIDPPDVMIGEFVPFWWDYDTTTDVQQVSSCSSLTQSNTNSSTLYVINSTNTTQGQLCHFYLRNGKWEQTRPFVKYCNIKQDFDTSELTHSYLDGASSVVNTSYRNAMWASYVAPVHWQRTDGRPLTAFGEYQIVWAATSYVPCVRNEQWSGAAWAPGSQLLSVTYATWARQIAQNAECSMNITATKPYMVQENGLSVTNEDFLIMDSIYNLNGSKAFPSASTPRSFTTSFAWSENLRYLVDQFVNKYVRLATTATTIWGNQASKVQNASIYILPWWKTLSNVSFTTNTTIIVPEGDVTLVWNIRGRVMFIVPKGSIYVKPLMSTNTWLTPNNQTLEGIYIAQQVESDLLHNIDINASWNFGGQLVINGLVVNMQDGNNTIKQLRDNRRSVLTDYTTNPPTSWFNTTNRSPVVQHGAALKVSTNPGLWTNLPPWANELMKELQAYR